MKARAIALLRVVGGAPIRASTLLVAIILVVVPLPVAAFDHDEFCTSVSHIARSLNARAGRWLDRSTRHDGVQVDCRLKTLETKRFLNANPDQMREGWEDRKQRAWNAAYCNDEAWREAIDNGWIIVSTLTFRMGKTVSFAAEC